MLVRDVMSAPVETLDASLTCAAAWRRLTAIGLRRAPVVEARRLFGMLTLSDLAAHVPHTIEELDQGTLHPAHHTLIRNVATTNLITLSANDHIELAARAMMRAKVSGLPVVDKTSGHNELVGILTESDIFKLFVRRTLALRGHRLILRAPAQPLGQIDPAAICVAAKAQLVYLGLYPLDGGRVSCILRVRTPSIDALLDAFQVAGYERVLIERD